MAVDTLHYVWLGTSLAFKAVGAVVLIAILRFCIRFYQVRSNTRRLAREYDIRMLPHSFWFGHIPAIAKTMTKYPRDASGMSVPYLVAREHPELLAQGLIYLDTWPFGLTIAVLHPDMQAQIMQEQQIPKPQNTLRRQFGPYTGCNDLFCMEGQTWKLWRSIFNPGFSAKNLTALLPGFLEEIDVFRQTLRAATRSGEVVQLHPILKLLTVDIICLAVFAVRVQSQTTNSAFLKALKGQVAWMVSNNGPLAILTQMNPVRPFIMWNNNRILRNFLVPHIERDLADTDSEGHDAWSAKTISSLAAKAYLKETLTEVKPKRAATVSAIDPRFVDMVVSQMKLFIFAGHDTTAASTSAVYNQVYSRPPVLAAVRAEHDRILGPEPSQARAILSENPQLLHQMPYTLAVIKETLRLFPPAGAPRQGSKTLLLTHPVTGKRFPTEGFMLFTAHWGAHRSMEHWEDADDFLPERWLVREVGTHQLESHSKNAYRPFEIGPRSCIGQELAMLEMRAIMAMTMREFDFEPVYSADAPTVLGEKGYQVMKQGEIAGQVKDGFPARIKLRETLR